QLDCQLRWEPSNSGPDIRMTPGVKQWRAEGQVLPTRLSVHFLFASSRSGWIDSGSQDRNRAQRCWLPLSSQQERRAEGIGGSPPVVHSTEHMIRPQLSLVTDVVRRRVFHSEKTCALLFLT